MFKLNRSSAIKVLFFSQIIVASLFAGSFSFKLGTGKNGASFPVSSIVTVYAYDSSNNPLNIIEQTSIPSQSMVTLKIEDMKNRLDKRVNFKFMEVGKAMSTTVLKDVNGDSPILQTFDVVLY